MERAVRASSRGSSAEPVAGVGRGGGGGDGVSRIGACELLGELAFVAIRCSNDVLGVDMQLEEVAGYLEGLVGPCSAVVA